MEEQKSDLTLIQEAENWHLLELMRADRVVNQLVTALEDGVTQANLRTWEKTEEATTTLGWLAHRLPGLVEASYRSMKEWWNGERDEEALRKVHTRLEKLTNTITSGAGRSEREDKMPVCALAETYLEVTREQVATALQVWDTRYDNPHVLRLSQLTSLVQELYSYHHADADTQIVWGKRSLVDLAKEEGWTTVDEDRPKTVLIPPGADPDDCTGWA